MSDKPAKHVPNEEPIDDEIAQVLQAVAYPANKDALVDAARAAGVSNDVVFLFDGLPEQDYRDADSVEQLLGSNGGPGLSI
ncbi:Superfamily II DNA and RNA helicase [Candidatus Paraburkholderia calva]|nr:Superfamily II DNA and RNA helicase [Candidatus Paraburkholderia calva]